MPSLPPGGRPRCPAGRRPRPRLTSPPADDAWPLRIDIDPLISAEVAVAAIALYRDHRGDQTLRLINQGYIHSEIAEMMELPPDLDQAWHARGYYGSVNHNVKAIYQRYLGWYDANPAHLWPPERAPQRAPPAMLSLPRGRP